MSNINQIIKEEYVFLARKYLDNKISTKLFSDKCVELANRMLRNKNKDYELLSMLFISESLVVYKDLSEVAPVNHLKDIRQYLQENK